MDLHTLSIIIDEAYVMYPKLNGKIEVVSKGSTRLFISFDPRFDVDTQEDRDCTYPQDSSIHFNALDLTIDQVWKLISDYRTYINFGLEDFKLERFGV